MGKLKILGDVVEGGLGMMRNASKAEDAAKEVTAAERAAAGRKAAELIKSQQQVKASEALGQLREKGMKRTTTTQADRTRVGGGNIGGAPFSAISEADPLYAGKVWGVMDEGTASRLTNLTDPETAWTTMLGSANQLKTNPIVFDKLKKGFLESMKQGNLSPELEAKINHNLALTFGEGASIRDPSIWKQADTFEKRGALADLMMGQGITPKKGGVALGGEKSGKGVIFKPTDILKKETEPYLLHTEHGGDIPTFAAGPRLFKLEKESEFRPDLHPGFPTLIKGKDLGYNVIPTPTEIYLPDWHKAFKQKKPERFQGPWSPEIVQRRKSGSYQLKGGEGPGYYDLALGLEGEGLPSQELTDEYIRHLIREGFKDGGKVKVDDFDAKVDKLIQNHHFDNHVDKRIKEHFAKGGDVKLARTSLRMAGGGMLSKGIGKLGKRLMADPTESAVTSARRGERTANEKGGNTIIKETGGNWLGGAFDDSVKSLKTRTVAGETPAQRIPKHEALLKDKSLNQDQIDRVRHQLEVAKGEAAVDKWVESNLSNYVKKQMGTPEDPVRKLAEEGVSHLPKNLQNPERMWTPEDLALDRKRQGFPEEGVAKHPTAQMWEQMADQSIYPTKAKEIQQYHAETAKRNEAVAKYEEHLRKLDERLGPYLKSKGLNDAQIEGLMRLPDSEKANILNDKTLNKLFRQIPPSPANQQFLEEASTKNPWISKLDPNETVYTNNVGGLGFDHIIDVLREDVTTGRIRPEQLNKVSMEQAVRRTAEYDRELAEKMNAGRAAARAELPVKKEYPEGYKWVELNRPGDFAAESEAMGHSARGYEPPPGHPDWVKGSEDRGNPSYGLGGWEAIKSGKAKVYSLVDAKGEPHVTIEIGKDDYLPRWDDVKQYMGAAEEEAKQLPHGYTDMDISKIANRMARENKPEYINQIKGKGNAKPRDEYLPFVQDFVKSGDWANINDFKNTGFEWQATGPKGVFDPQDIKVLEQAGYTVPKYLTNAEKDDFMRKLYETQSGNSYETGLPKVPPTPEAPPAEGMANGGGVLKYTTLRNRSATQSQPNRFSVGGILKHTTLRGMKDGGTSEMKPTPRKKGYGVASDVLKGVHEFASKPFGYENPPVEFISELLGIPAASRVLDKLSYGEPITNAGKANVPLIPDDTFDAATALLGGLGTASKLAKPLAKAAKKLPKDLPVGMSIKPVGTSIFGEKIMPTARIGLEAPGILIPSKMNNVREAVRNTKGNYGARRVERAADEIPNLERMYQEDALKEAFTGDNASAMMSINPSDFEKFARELDRKTSVGPKAAELAKQGDIDKMTVTTDEYIKHLQRLKDGFSDVPYLNLTKDDVGLPTMPKVIGHEGRHRNRALADMGEKSSLVKINPRGDLREGMPRRTQEDYIEALREELERSNRLVLPETDPWFRRPEIQLPDIYAKGGPILKHTTLRNRKANQRVR
jgi:hypothetical protein